MRSMQVDRQSSTVSASRRRTWPLRLVSIMLGLSVFVLLELVCLAFGWGESRLGDDPLVGFASVRPLFELESDRLQYHTSPARRGYFKEVSFAAEKPDSEFRIFVFGGSTVQGNPYSIETSFPTYLQIALESADPSRDWKVINCGGVSYASHRLLPVMKECLNYQPDLFVFCGGHNQFLEHISFENVRDSAAITGPALSVLSRFRSFRILQRALNGNVTSASVSVGSHAVLPVEVDTLLDQPDGLTKYHRNDRLAGIIAQSFAQDLRSMSTITKQHDLPLLFLLPPSNLGDCPPFKSEFSATLTVEVRAEIQSLLIQSRQLVTSDLSRAIELLQEATSKDSRFAPTWYELGQLQLAAMDFAAAETALRRARDEDICPLRITTPLESAMQEVTEETTVPLIDAHELLTRRCRNGIAGDAILVDHVHPTFRGHEDMAIAIAEWMLSTGLATEANVSWKENTVEECRHRLLVLDDLYFHRGRRALRSLRLWAAGRSQEIPLVPESEFNSDDPTSQRERNHSEFTDLLPGR
jgi:hypothetical protein